MDQVRVAADDAPVRGEHHRPLVEVAVVVRGEPAQPVVLDHGVELALQRSRAHPRGRVRRRLGRGRLRAPAVAPRPVPPRTPAPRTSRAAGGAGECHPPATAPVPARAPGRPAGVTAWPAWPEGRWLAPAPGARPAAGRGRAAGPGRPSQAGRRPGR
jgi:hypothetical protein